MKAKSMGLGVLLAFGSVVPWLAAAPSLAAGIDPPGYTCTWSYYSGLEDPYQGMCDGIPFVYDGVSTWPNGYFTVNSIPYGEPTEGDTEFPCREYDIYSCPGTTPPPPACAWGVDVATGKEVYTCR